MTDFASTSAEDIAYVRRLAESGARAPLIGGRFMAWWGLLLTLAWSAQHFALHGIIGDGAAIFGIIWGTFALLGLAGQFTLARTMGPRPGAGSAGNRASQIVWAAGGCAITSMFVGLAFLTRGPLGEAAFDWIVPVAFSVYACALIATGALARDRTALLAGAGAVVMVGLYTAFILDPSRYLVAAGGGAATVLLPGVLLMLREPRAEERGADD